MRLTDQQSIPQRVEIIEEALASVLDRDGAMAVEPGGEPGTLFVWVIAKPFSEERTGFSLNQIARELEVLLS